MHLKRIEISGFKSFANRTIIDFEKNVTAIVGPNGSGKSNITEAIRWVLGEQSAKSLRGGKMPDIIFAGSDAKKALNLAEVTMVLDNSDHYLPVDYAEVSVKRRLFRNGDSEFYLNNQSCRLRDIQELFMDSGLGRESFSIISQGKVEAIFSSKAEDRRGIFEEAAGVLKYKQKKKQAEQKLFETQDNLDRLADIIYELTEQLTPLAQQKQAAQQFLTYKEELTQVDVSYVVQEMQQSKQVWEEEKAQIASLKQEVQKLSHALTQSENELLRLRQDRAHLDEQLEEKNQDHLHLVEALKQAEGKKAVLQERSFHQQKNAKELRHNLEQVQQQIEQLEENQQTLIQKISQKNGQYQQIEKQLVQLQQELAKYQKSPKEWLEELRNQYLDQLQAKTNLQNELTFIEKQKQQDQQKNQQTVEKQQDLQATVRESKVKLDQLTVENEALQNQVQAKQQALAAAQKQVTTQQEHLQKAQQMMYRLMNESQQVQARRKTLADLQENYTGYYQGVRQVLTHRKQLSGIIGAVAELLDVDQLYALAIETALGAASQYIVVEDEKAARQAITFLKQQRAGRATFLPLTTIQSRKVTENVKQQAASIPGFLGVASELVTFEENHRAIMENLLGATLISEDLESANQLARRLNYRYRVVSLEGDVMNAGGSMTGGANKRSGQTTLLGHQQELNQLKAKEASVKERLLQAESQVKTFQQDLAQKQAEVEKMRQALEQLRMSQTTKENQVTNQAEKLARLQQDLTNFEFENREITELLAEYDRDLADKQAQLQVMVQQLAKLNEEMDQLNTQADNLELKREALQQELADKQAEFAVTKEQVNQLRQSFTANKMALEEAQKNLEQLNVQLSMLDADFSDQELDEETLDQQVSQLNERKLALQEEMQALRENRYQTQRQIDELDQQYNTFNQEQKAKLSQLTKLEVQANRSEILLDNRLNYLQEEYELSFEQAQKQALELSDIDQAKARIYELKKAIQELGPINLSAIEQYEQIKERYDFLTGQRDDLLQAKNQLFETMNEMDEEVKLRFKTTFDAIATQFERVFPNMFGGGRARLSLTDPHDLLNTGVEIEAQPPGKHLKSLNLLSGGERTLTAISLLFAIIQVRPVPFCVLDEVEAALDEANVLRFGKYLQTYQDETQFIVVTHRKGTMEAANVLYGVTMEESGISKVLSVRLEEISEGGNLNRKEDNHD
ncbi:chromosome segregation protein SMC [Enterococcus cecorum]|uniref:chromosome segregation protein SMC n=1 Tax=Enterococcus cecorum TaxID=44008 RepID=UPI00148DBFAA|nr:chromosome segregation protein SMC [Enterococcus cecorum]MDZ5440595.1 chromosome segregation protein SMC [Enterococcus cecorum]MDZ5498668.1 chromosome segregation protein SMC [Enterococcus cecorum]MDZ5500705.1 chromosome segregation protein SMC [Enterococcus cecorum]MDZ5563017.1 chromosome segregation protein SMC [Enterococcus cecorum]